MDVVLVQYLLLGGVYALIALGFILVFKSSGVLNLAHGKVVAIAAYFLYQMLDVWGLPAWLGILLVILSGAVLGFLIERLAVRPLLGQPFLSVMMMTLMLGMLLEGVRYLIWGADSFVLSFAPKQGQGWLGTLLPDWVSPANALSFVVAMLVFLLLTLLFRYTKIGLSMRVVAADHEVAQSLGIRVKRVFSISWAMSGAFAALCGVLMGMVLMVTPNLGDMVLGLGLPVLLLGGLNSIPGAVVGGLIIGLAQGLGSYYQPWGLDVKEIAPWIVMLVILLIRPWGLFGEKRIERI
jgi:branched-chain amino acid transport system permease protein